MKTILMLTAFASAVALSACAPTQDNAPGGEPTPVACKAGDYQEYVGRNRSTIPADAPRGLDDLAHLGLGRQPGLGGLAVFVAGRAAREGRHTVVATPTASG